MSNTLLPKVHQIPRKEFIQLETDTVVQEEGDGGLQTLRNWTTIMFLKELSRFFTQNRTFYCYLILSVWIFLLIAGMYKYINITNPGNSLNFLNTKPMYVASSPAEENLKLKRYKQYCTPVDGIYRKDDGGLLEGWKLQGVLLVIRHGDRGPMSHVKGISSIDCGVESDSLVHRYKTFLQNVSSPSGSNHMYWNKIGPFHGFALLPPTSKACLLMQLTYKGISQLLHIGEILHQVYAHPLGLLQRSQSASSKSTINPTPLAYLNSEEVIVYTTRYRRTFQSAMALLYAFLPTEKWIALNVRESHSMSFCFSDCVCPQVDELRKKSSKYVKTQLAQHSVVSAVVQWLGQLLLHHSSNGATSAYDVRDAVLAILCHNAPLPCKKANTKDSKSSITISPPTTLDLSDVINIDQDDPTGNVAPGSEAADRYETEPQSEGCIENSHITALMSFTNWLSGKEARQSYYKRTGVLRAYGLIRHIVGYMLKMISGDRTKFVLYSGHDWTMQFLTAAFGIDTETTFIPYASRMAFEVYKSESNTEYYFRVIYNGRDVTQQIDFCEGGKSLRVTRDSRGNKADLCPIENIIRFIHDDYFVSLNATNFKDACTIQNLNEF